MTLTHANLVVFAAVASVVLVIRYIWWRFFSYQGIPKHLPWAGAPDGSAFARARANLKSFFGLRNCLLEGYQQYSKKGRLFILPNIVNGHEVILPTNYMGWLLDQPDSVLSQYETNRQFMCGDYTMLHQDMLGKNWPRLEHTVKRELTRELDDYVEMIADEIQDSLRSLWGNDTEEWRELDLYDVMLEVVGRATNRIFVGFPLCRNPAYLQASTGFSKYILLWAMAIEMLPAAFKPIIGPVLTYWDYLQYKRMTKFISPILSERIARLPPQGATLEDLKNSSAKQRKSDTSAEEPNDYIQWALRDTLRHGESPRDPRDFITKRLAITSFTAIQSSAITITNAVVDLAATAKSVETQEELRSEVLASATRENPATRWFRNSLAQLPKLDSVLTETLRLWGILTHGVTKAVMAPEGITLPTGEHIPRGVKIGIASYGPHLDGDVYGAEVSPLVFDAFRFTRPGHKREGAMPGLSFVTTTEHYMGFSHGRHACPGRYFANSLLKILLAHIVLLYEIEPIKERPQNPWLNNTIGPPIGVKVRVRRRKVDSNTFLPLEVEP